MLEITIAVCPPEGERRVLLMGRIINVTPGSEVADYNCDFQCNGAQKSLLLREFPRTRGLSSLVSAALSRFGQQFGGLIRERP
jgi:hypothetical protein